MFSGYAKPAPFRYANLGQIDFKFTNVPIQIAPKEDNVGHVDGEKEKDDAVDQPTVVSEGDSPDSAEPTPETDASEGTYRQFIVSATAIDIFL